MFIRYFWLGNHHTYGHIRCVYTVLADPSVTALRKELHCQQPFFNCPKRLFKLIQAFGWCVGLARTIHIRCIYGIFGREIIKYTVIYGVYIRFWPTLVVRNFFKHRILSSQRLNCSFSCVCDKSGAQFL